MNKKESQSIVSGLFYPDGSFRTKDQVSRKVILDKLQRPRVVQRTDFPPERDFPRWTEIITRQQNERQELFGIPEHVDIEIQTREPVVFVPIGDIHAGGSEVNYLGFAKDVDIVREMGFMVATFGDLTDSYFFMPEVSEQLIAGDEQILYMQSALAFMAEDGLLLAGWGGDHDCLDEETEIYTKRGWLKWDEFGEDDDILTINPDNGLLEWYKYEKKIVKDYSGELIRIKTRHIDLLATKNHRIFYQKRKRTGDRIGKFGFIYLGNLIEKQWLSRYLIPNASTFGLPDYPIEDNLLRIIAWLITDGWIKERKKYGYKRVFFTQRKEKAHLITDILDSLEFDYSVRERNRTRESIDGRKVKEIKPSYTIGVKTKDSKEILKYIPDKHKLPDYIFDLSDRQFGIFLSSLIDGDGTQSERMSNSACFYQKDKSMIDDLQAICTMHNIKTSIYEYENRMGNKQYRLNICFRNNSRLDGFKVKRKYYKGKIWDISIPPNRNFLVRRNGKSYFTGNCWSKDKSGAHTLYQGFRERYGAHYLEGVSYLTLHLTNEDGEVAYPIVGAHRHRGYSVYNDAHAALRQLRDEGIAPDSKHCISITAHKHIKAYLHQVHKLHGGEEVNFHCLALGAYKESDRYSRKRGWPRMGEDSQGAFGIIMYPNEQKVDVCWDLQEARDKLLK